MPNRVADLDIGAVERADRYCPVHGEFHVARARRLFACRGDLFRQIGGGIDALTVLDVKVRQERHLENLRDERVLIDGPRDGIDQLDDQLGHPISRRGLAISVDVPAAIPERWRHMAVHIDRLAVTHHGIKRPFHH